MKVKKKKNIYKFNEIERVKLWFYKISKKYMNINENFIKLGGVMAPPNTVILSLASR